MSILRFDAIRREIGTFVVLGGASGAIAAGDRIGLVGANGAGKTTLLRIAAGLEEPDAGSVHRRRGLTLGLLPQEANLDEAFVSAPSLRVAVRSGAAETEALERELELLESRGTEGVESERYADLRARFETRDGYGLDQRVEATLSGLGFAREEWDRSPRTLSGGEQTRAALARLMVADPELLMLDEPTNHLDLDALEWLEQALARRVGSLLVASHDRAFLDAVVTRVWELRDRRLERFRGDYSAYLVQREARDARQRLQAGTRHAEIAREQELIQRYRSHRKYSKMHEHERRLAALQPIDEPSRSPGPAITSRALLGGGPVRSGDVAVRVEEALVGFPARDGVSPVAVARVPRLEAMRGERIGIVGPNGAGKTTLLRTIAGELHPLEGVVRFGAGVQPAYLAQVRRSGPRGATVLDALLSTAAVEAGPARSYLARFLFRGDEVFKPVAELSGGERSRLELALLGVMPANLLLLDEPTNHLDIAAREALESFLRDSEATILLVSHDRRLLESVCERLWVVEPAPAGRAGGHRRELGRVAPFDGHYAEWRAARAEGWTVERELERRVTGRPGSASPVAAGREAQERTPPTVRPPTARLSKDAYRRHRALVDEDLSRLGLRKSHLELALGDPRVQANFVELRRLSSELADVDAALARAEEAWLALEERAPP